MREYYTAKGLFSHRLIDTYTISNMNGLVSFVASMLCLAQLMKQFHPRTIVKKAHKQPFSRRRGLINTLFISNIDWTIRFVAVIQFSITNKMIPPKQHNLKKGHT